MSCDSNCNPLVIGQAGPPGPQGLPGINGTIGADGVNAFTTVFEDFQQPTAGQSVTFTVADNRWIAIGQILYISQAGLYSVVSIGSSSTNTVTANLISTDGVNPGSPVAAGKKVTPSSTATFQGSVPSLTVLTGGTTSLDGPTVINDSGNDANFRVEGLSDEYLIFCKASSGGSGRVGISTNTPEALLHVDGTFQVGTVGSPASSLFTGSATINQNLTVTGTAQIESSITTGSSLTVAGDVAVDNYTFVVNSLQNFVGINKTTPTVALDVIGATAISGTLGLEGNLRVGAGASNVLKVLAASSFVGINKTTPTVALDVIGATAISDDLKVGSTGTLTVLPASGFVGIAKTNPTVALDVAGAVSVTGNVLAGVTTGAPALTVNSANKFVGIAKTTPAVPLDVVGAAAISGNLSVGGTNTLTVNTTSNFVGINKTNPILALDVIGDFSTGVGANFPLVTTAATNTVALGNANVSGNATVSGNLNVGAGSVLSVATSIAKVGINKTVPTVALDVVGDMTVTGTSTFNSLSIPGNFSVGAAANIFTVTASSGFVGIRKTTPTVALDVIGAAAISSTMGIEGNLRVGASGASVLQVLAATNFVGINKTTPTVALDVIGVAAISGNFTVGTNTLSVLPASGFVGIAKTTPTVPLDVIGAAAISGDLKVGTSILSVLSSSGFVGINKATPTVALDVIGAAAVSGATTISGNFTVGSTSTLSVLPASGFVGIAKTTPTVPLDVIGAAAISGNFTVGTGAANFSILSSSGYVGIKKTTPSVPLDVIGDAAISGNFTVGTNILSVLSSSGYVGIAKATPTVPLDVTGAAAISGNFTVGSTSTLSVLPASGFVGIAKATPAVPLDVNGAAAISGNLSVGTSANIFSILSASGNVGIKKTAPTVPLDVIGDTVISSGNLTVNGQSSGIVLYADKTSNAVGINTSSVGSTHKLVVNGSVSATDLTVSGTFDSGTFLVNAGTTGGGAASQQIFAVRGAGTAVTYPISVKGTITPLFNGVGIFNSDPAVALDINGDVRITGGFLRRTVTPISATTYSLATADNYIIFSSATTVTFTLPLASASLSGRELTIKSTASVVNSASANVIPLAGGSATSSILSGAGKWCTLVCDGASWFIMTAN
jgi:hypothetical protein